MLTNFSIDRKLLVALILPVIAMVGFAAHSAFLLFERAARMERVVAMAELVPPISDLVHQLQRERGLSAGYLATGFNLPGNVALKRQWAETDRVLRAFRDAAARFDPTPVGPGLAKLLGEGEAALSRLPAVRESVLDLLLNTADMTRDYGGTIQAALSILAGMVSLDTDSGVANRIAAYLALAQLKEKAGQERATGLIGFNTSFTPHRLMQMASLAAAQDTYLDLFAVNAGPALMGEMERIVVAGAPSRDIRRLRAAALGTGGGEGFRQIAGAQWFETTTRRIDRLQEIEKLTVADLVAHAGAIQADAFGRAALMAGIALIAILATIGIVFILSGNIRSGVRQVTEGAGILAAAIEQSSNAVIVTDREGRIQWTNRAVETQSGYSLADLIGHKPSRLKSGHQSVEFYRRLWQTITAGKVWRGELVNQRKDGSLYRVKPVITPLIDPAGAITHFVAIEEDVTEIAETRAILQRVQNTDPLTGLLSRASFVQALERVATDDNDLIAVVDIDKLHHINQTAGREIGDKILRAVARALEGHPAAALAGRVGDDEFAIVIAPGKDAPQALPQAALRGATQIDAQIAAQIEALRLRLEQAAAQDAGYDGLRLRIGYAMAGADGESNIELFAHAETALRAARTEEHCLLARYDKEWAEQRIRGQKLRQALRQALPQNQISFHIQPKVDLRTGRRIGGEVLMRWAHPEIGAVSPAEFIPVAERTRDIHDLGRATWTMALRLAQEPALVARPEMRLAVNVSAVELSQPGFARETIARVAGEGQDPRRFIVELTETAAASAGDTLRRELATMLDHGFGIDIDDFGTGYASLTQLRDLPFTGIKIDREFVDPILQDRNSQLIVQGVISLAKSFDATVVAEGVESAEHAALLHALGCDYGQGYHFDKPAPAEQFLASLAV